MTYEKAEDPIRLVPTSNPVRLVIGWAPSDVGLPRPVLDRAIA
jgi:hypothetical protein